MRILLKIISGFLAVFVILVASVFLIINLVDWNRHRDFLIRNVERYTSVRIDELEGIRLSLWRSLDFEVQKFKMHSVEKEAGLDSFSTGPAHLRVAVWPLLARNQLLIQTLTVDKARLHLKETKKSEEEPAEDAASPAEVLSRLPDIFINGAAITDARFRYDTRAKKEPIQVSIEKFEMQAPEKDPTPRFRGLGSIDEYPWKIEGETGTLEAFEEEGKPFPLRLHAELGRQELDLNAKVRFADATGNFTLKAKGPDIEQIKKILHLNIGTVPAWQLAIDSRLEPDNFRLDKVELKLGASEMNGNLQIDLRPARPKISGKLESPVTAQKDFAGLFQTDQRYKPEDEVPKPAGQYFSDKPIDIQAMKKVDLDVRYLVNHYRGEKSGRAIRAWDVTVKMDNGNLRIEPLTIAVASGKVGGHFRIDGRKLPVDVSVEMGAKRVDLTSLLGPIAKEIPVFDMKPSDMARGLLTGQLDLKMTGKSPMELARSVKGPIELAVEDGALASTAIEAFGIDVTQTVSSWIQDHPLYEIQCALTAFEAGGGAIKTKTFLISTKDTSIVGKGEVNLVGNKVDFVLEAHPHDFSIGSLRSPIVIKGPLDDFKVGLERKELLTRSGLAVALGALVNPIAALVPLIETGLDESGKCRSVMKDLNEVAAKATKLSKGQSKDVRR